MSVVGSTVNGVARIEIARPEKKNAITAAMYQLMADALAAAHDDCSVRAILICGQKDIFTAGNDLEDFMKNPPADMNNAGVSVHAGAWLRGETGDRCGQRCRGRHRHDDVDAL
jgi:enoyl-CoA hydratase/carnithine racemase